jgi:hypothetical protein
MADITQPAPAPFVWGAGGAQMTPERIAAERKLAETLMQQGMDYSPVQHVTQGMARVAQALMGGYDYNRTNEAERANMAADRDMIKGWFGGGTAPPAAAVAPAVVPARPVGDRAMALDAAGQPVVAVDGGIVPPAPDYGKAIAGIESGGRYDALGPVTKTGDRAYGKYQVMGANVGPWTKEILGTELTPQAFAASPDAQDAVFKGKFGQYVQQTGNPQDAASMWFSGRPMVGNTSKDQLGTSVPTYVQKFAKALGSSGAPAEDPAALPPNATPTQGYAIPGQPAAPASPFGGVNPGVVAALTSPYTSPGTKHVAQMILQHQMGDKVQYQTLPDGTILQMDPMGRSAPKPVYQAPTKLTHQTLPDGTVLEIDPTGKIPPKPVYQAASKPTFGVVGKDQFGNDVHGFIDTIKQTTMPVAAPSVGAPGAPIVITGPDGKPITVPAGQDPRKFRDHITTISADVAGGKSTEVQAKSEKFGNKMELAERNIRDIETEGQSLTGRAKEYVPGGNLVQTDKYQKFKQARDNFITALLRDESGAAIGTAEFNRYEKELFPQPGDGAEVVAQKREARRIALEAMKKAAGPGYKSPVFDAPSGKKTASGVTWSVE